MEIPFAVVHYGDAEARLEDFGYNRDNPSQISLCLSDIYDQLVMIDHVPDNTWAALKTTLSKVWTIHENTLIYHNAELALSREQVDKLSIALVDSMSETRQVTRTMAEDRTELLAVIDQREDRTREFIAEQDEFEDQALGWEAHILGLEAQIKDIKARALKARATQNATTEPVLVAREAELHVDEPATNEDTVGEEKLQDQIVRLTSQLAESEATVSRWQDRFYAHMERFNRDQAASQDRKRKRSANDEEDNGDQ